MTTISAKDARATFSDLINRVAYGKEEAVITRNGRNVAAVIPMDLYALLESVLEEFEYDKDVREAREALAEADREGTVPWDEAKSEIGR